MEHITSTDLFAALGVQPQTVGEWPAELQPPMVEEGMHCCEDVNKWLAEPGRACGFAVPPEIEKILAGHILLVSQDDAAQMLGRTFAIPDPDSQSLLQYAIHRKRIAALCWYNGACTVTAASLRALIGYCQAHIKLFTIGQLRHILGFVAAENGSNDSEPDADLRKLLRSHGLEVVEGPQLRVTRKSVVLLLGKLLPATVPKMDAEDWIEDRFVSLEPLLTLEQAAERVFLMPVDMEKLLQSGQIHSIMLPDGAWFVSPDSIALYQQTIPPLTNEEISKIFGFSDWSAVQWRRDGLLVCPLHQNCRLHRWCMVAYVQPRCAHPGMSAAEWVARQLTASSALLTKRQIRDNKILTGKQLQVGIESGRIPAIHAPNGSWVYLEKAVLEEAKRYG